MKYRLITLMLIAVVLAAALVGGEFWGSIASPLAGA
jgi:hypothetical protein